MSTKRIFYSSAVALASACAGGTSDTASQGGTSDVFVAYASNFTGYHSWQSFDVTGDAGLAGIHDGSTVTEYLNKRPPPGQSQFPVGTIIVKEATGGTVVHELFAMVKHGGAFNPEAPGWEWFEIQNLPDGKDDVSIVWRGYTAPQGTYGGSPNGNCNTCHTKCGNDAVCAKPLNLANF